MTLQAFDEAEKLRAKIFLAAQAANMMGRKLEEGDWSAVYNRAKGIPASQWSNLHIDVNWNGLGVEHKMVRVSGLNGRPIQGVCGTTRMHPALTRSIRIEDVTKPADEVMTDVLTQYGRLVDDRTAKVAAKTPGKKPDMRLGWLLWEDDLYEFLYFEEPMLKPDPTKYKAEWNVTLAKGARKPSKSLWIYDRASGQKRYSVTTSAGIKIQPYFDVPTPSDPNLYYFRVQSEPIGSDTIHMWLLASTARVLESRIGALTRENVSQTALALIHALKDQPPEVAEEGDLAVAVPISTEAYKALVDTLGGVSDEHRGQLLLRALAKVA